MRLTNTLTGELAELAPLVPRRVGMYVCGVTPYAESHVGHAMAAIIYDVLVRYLRWPGNPAGGYEVSYVSNYTDIDDNVIARAAELGRDPLELVAENIEVWEQQQRALHLTFPDVRPRVTEHIEMIVAAIEAIVERGYGYVTDLGDVYFRVRAKSDYGKLSHRNIEQLRSGTRAEPGEGKGVRARLRVVEGGEGGRAVVAVAGGGRGGQAGTSSARRCRSITWGRSSTSMGAGSTSCSRTTRTSWRRPRRPDRGEARIPRRPGRFARLWLHNGLVQHDGEKMSKSLGNVVTVREALERWRPDALRLFVLGSHYRSPNNLTDEAMAAAEAGVDRLLTALEREAPEAATGAAAVDASGARERFVAAMEDDLGTPQALATVFELARTVNRGRDAGEDVRGARALLGELARDVLGLRLEERAGDAALDVVALSKLASAQQVVCGGTDAPSTIEALLAARQEARAGRDFERADAIRAGLAAAGVEVEDTAEGPRWVARTPSGVAPCHP